MHIDVNGTTLFVDRFGSGRPMLVLHGGLGLDHTYFRPWLDPLGELVELIYLDLRGNGRSARPADWSTVDHEVWVSDIEAIRRHFDFDEILLFGHSYGGYFAQEYALEHPQNTAGLLLCDTSPRADHDAQSFAAVAARATPEQAEVLATAFTTPFRGSDSDFLRTYREILPLYFAEPTDEKMHAVVARMRASPGAFNRGFLECRPNFDTTDRLASITAPTLAMSGRHDWIVPPEAGSVRLHAALPNCELLLFEESGHFPFIEENGAFLETTRDWIERVLR